MTIGQKWDAVETIHSLKNTIIQKKLEKRERLKTAAYRLFRIYGVDATAIDDIVRDSQVAKGTFYLYFKNKTEILTEIVMDKSHEILSFAFERVRLGTPVNRVEAITDFIDKVVDLLGEDPALLELIYKNLSWGFYQKVVSESESDETLKELKTAFHETVSKSGTQERDAEKLLFIIIELTSSICYSAIILHEPATMSEMKPILLESVRRIIS
jgi:AcrR family transcriptional regulator